MIHECALEISGKEKRTKKGKFILVPKCKERDSSVTASWYLCYLFALVSYHLALLCCLCVSLNIPCWSCLTGAVCCVFGLCQCVPVIHGTVHLFSSPLNVPSQRGARLHPQSRTPAPSDLQLSCSSSNLELFPLVLSCLLLLCTHLRFLIPSFIEVSEVLFEILCFALVFQGV